MISVRSGDLDRGLCNTNKSKLHLSEDMEAFGREGTLNRPSPFISQIFSGVGSLAHFRWFPAYFFFYKIVRELDFPPIKWGQGEWSHRRMRLGAEGGTHPPMGPEFRCAGAPKIRNEGLFSLKWTCAPLRQFWPYAYDCASFPTRTSPYWILH